MTDWPIPDGLEPPGEQLELPWLDPPVVAEVVETIVHRVRWDHRSWSCTCGAGTTWPVTAAPWRPKRGARFHLHAVRRRIGARPP